MTYAVAYLLARVLTCGIWVAAGAHKATHYRANIAEMGHLGVPLPHLVLPLVLILEMVGATLMILDEYVWLVSLAWIAFMIPATWLYHSRGVQGVTRRLHGMHMDIRGELVTLHDWSLEPRGAAR